MSHLLARLRSAFAPPVPTPDVELLTRFLDRNDQDAFTELVRRYRSMVLGVCRRTLGDGPDADDAYQAAFLVLAKRAATVRGFGRVAGWLHGVATLCAKKVRVRRAKARQREQTGGLLTDVPGSAPETSDLPAVLDEELASIPEKYRTAVVLCELRQLTLDQAAAELGVPRGTVASRLARGREALGKRLLRRGLFSLVPPVLCVEPPPVAPTPAAESLSREVLRTMTVSNLRWLPLAVIPIVVVAAGLLAADPPKTVAQPPKAEEKAKRNATVERVKLIGVGGLLEQETVRKNIGLTKEQEAKIDTQQDQMRKQLKMLRTAIQASQTEQPEFTDIQRMMDSLSECVLQIDAAALTFLTADQQYRLKQIQLQRDGPNALLGRHAVRELALTPDQEDKIAEVLKKLNTPKLSDFTTTAKGNPDDPRAARFLTAYAVELDSAREEALKLLTADQQAKWKVLTGEALPTVCLIIATPDAYVYRENFKLAGAK